MATRSLNTPDPSLEADTRVNLRPAQRIYRKILPAPFKIEGLSPTRPGFTITPENEETLQCLSCLCELMYPYWFTLCGHVCAKF